jgi:hypothetical protein
VSSVEERQRRPEDVGAIRTRVAVHCHLLDDADWPALVLRVVDGGPPVAAGRYTDELVPTQPGRGHRVEQVRFSYWAPLTDGWDASRYEFAGAVPPEAPA